MFVNSWNENLKNIKLNALQYGDSDATSKCVQYEIPIIN